MIRHSNVVAKCRSVLSYAYAQHSEISLELLDYQVAYLVFYLLSFIENIYH